MRPFIVFRASRVTWLAAGLSIWLAACGSSGGEATGGGSGGNQAAGGTGTGGNATGGATGGSPGATGGATAATGGAPATGGAAGAPSSTGGAAGAPVVPGTGGARGGAGGGMATGGSPGSSGGSPGSAGNSCATPPAPPACSGPPGAYVNPATGSTGIHDPSIVAEGCTFYGFATGSVLPNRTSTDLVHWSSYSGGSFALPSWIKSGAQIWAPDVHYANGKFWNYYSIWNGSVSTAQIGLITSPTLDTKATDYKWADQGLVVDNAGGGGSGVNVIDPDLFIDDDGSWWLVYGSFNKGVRLIGLDPRTGLPPSRPVAPTTLTDHLGEGSSLIKNHGYYYLFVSRGGCCSGTSSSYEVVYARASKVTGPYTTKSGRAFATSSYQDSTDALLPVGADGDTGGQGGQSFFKVGSQWYIDYHAYVAGANPAKLVVRPIYFDSNDWATFDCSKAAH